MSALTLIRKDSHGLYVRTGGYVFRPNPNKATFLREGDRTKAHHISGTVRAKVANETWFSHGAYCTAEGVLSTEQCYVDHPYHYYYL